MIKAKWSAEFLLGDGGIFDITHDFISNYGTCSVILQLNRKHSRFHQRKIHLVLHQTCETFSYVSSWNTCLLTGNCGQGKPSSDSGEDKWRIISPAHYNDVCLDYMSAVTSNCGQGKPKLSGTVTVIGRQMEERCKFVIKSTNIEYKMILTTERNAIKICCLYNLLYIYFSIT